MIRGIRIAISCRTRDVYASGMPKRVAVGLPGTRRAPVRPACIPTAAYRLSTKTFADHMSWIFAKKFPLHLVIERSWRVVRRRSTIVWFSEHTASPCGGDTSQIFPPIAMSRHHLCSRLLFCAFVIVGSVAVSGDTLAAQQTAPAATRRARVAGRVTDAASGQPVAGASVQVVGTAVTA
jgi:hypothetical protein